MDILNTGRIPLNSYGIGVQGFRDYRAESDRGVHAHDFIELVYLARGSMTHSIDGETYAQTAGQLAIINYGTSHQLFSRGVDLFNIYIDLRAFPMDRLEPRIRRILDGVLLPHPSLANKHTRLRLVDLGPMPFYAALFGKLESAARQVDPGSADAVQGSDTAQLYGVLFLLSELASGIERMGFGALGPHGAALPALPPASAPLCGVAAMERVRGTLETDYAQDLRLDYLASLAGCSPFHLCRAFKAYAGVSIGVYLTSRRLRQAMFLLSTTKAKILSVALDSGFRDITHFNRTFKKYTAITASQYRRGQKTDRRFSEP